MNRYKEEIENLKTKRMSILLKGGTYEDTKDIDKLISKLEASGDTGLLLKFTPAMNSDDYVRGDIFTVRLCGGYYDDKIPFIGVEDDTVNKVLTLKVIDNGYIIKLIEDFKKSSLDNIKISWINICGCVLYKEEYYNCTLNEYHKSDGGHFAYDDKKNYRIFTLKINYSELKYKLDERFLNETTCEKKE